MLETMRHAVLLSAFLYVQLELAASQHEQVANDCPFADHVGCDINGECWSTSS